MEGLKRFPLCSIVNSLSMISFAIFDNSDRFGTLRYTSLHVQARTLSK